MSRRYVNQFGHQETVDEVFLASDKQLRPNRSGNLYLQVELSDRTGTIGTRMWNASEELYKSFNNGDYVRVEGTTQLFQGALQMIATRRRFLKAASAVIAAPALPRGALGDTWPKDRPIRAIVPFSAGASIDIIGRIGADGLSQQLGQSIVIMNRGGAGGNIGAKSVATADPDGYTLLINSSNHSIAPAIYSNLGFDVARQQNRDILVEQAHHNRVVVGIVRVRCYRI